MNKYSVWKYLVIVTSIVLGGIYSSPNLYTPDPAIQIAGKTTGLDMTEAILQQVRTRLERAKIAYFGEEVSDNKRSATIRFNNSEDQLTAKSFIQQQLGPEFVVALNLAPTTPQWLRNLGAQPMKLGLDLSGGVHFLMEVDTQQVIDNRLQGLVSQTPKILREADIRYRKLAVIAKTAIEVGFRSASDRDKAISALTTSFGTIEAVKYDKLPLYMVKLNYTEQEVKSIEDRAVLQNIASLRNRVNELGVSEPLVQRQGRNRIIVQLPGIQDTAEAKRIIGKTANLEFRLEYSPDRPKPMQSFPFRDTISATRSAQLERDIIVTGDQVSDASTGFDENGQPQVNITLNSEGGKKMHRLTRNNIGRRMGVLFIEYKSRIVKTELDDKGNMTQVIESYPQKKIINLATIQSALGVSFRITGIGNQVEAAELALLLRAGALAAPMIFVEERTVGPSLGAENVAKGVTSVQWGVVLVLLFMLIYYHLFGLFANLALTLNLVLLIACMSMLGATLTLPGIAGIVLTLGMSVDANILIFSRIREELKKGIAPQLAIDQGYSSALSTILDANITTLIVAIILYLIGSGPIQGFAVTLSIGILTSMYTAILGSRALVNLVYGSRQNVKKLAIGYSI